ncbi:MAG: porin family protein [Alphaproteobacteria bacterium]|nr:porin family protein [Alphaproteobacteria bacterium]
MFYLKIGKFNEINNEGDGIMKKVLLVSLMTMAAVSSTLAGAKHNVYVGLGAANVIGNHNAVITYATNNGGTSRILSNQFANSTGGIDINFGYMAALNNFTLGLEVDYLFGNLNKNNYIVVTGNNFSDRQKVESTSGAWGFGIRLGYSCIDRIHPFVRLGIESRRFKLTSITDNPAFSSFTGISSSDRKIAFAPGAGMDFNLNKNLALGVEYRYAFYGSITKTGPAQNVGGGLTRTATFKITPRVSTALISLKYIWG